MSQLSEPIQQPMPTNEEGEFELILGNRQLLSVFFIVVVLLGVFFTMGYIVGRNSAPVGGPEVAAVHKTDSKPIVVDSPAHDTPPAAAPPVSSAPPTETAVQQPIETKPEARPEVRKEAVKPPEPPKPSPAARETPKAKAPEPPKEPKKAPPVIASEPPAGGQTYLQLVATAKAEADVMVDVLRKKGFKARNVEIPEKPGTFRVLVGPLEDGSANKIRTDLQSAGFPGDKAIKKTF